MRNFANCDSICLLTFSHSLLIRLENDLTFQEFGRSWNMMKFTQIKLIFQKCLMGWVGWVKTQEVFRCVINSNLSRSTQAKKWINPEKENATLQGTSEMFIWHRMCFLGPSMQAVPWLMASTCQNVRKLLASRLAQKLGYIVWKGTRNLFILYFSVFGLLAPFLGIPKMLGHKQDDQTCGPKLSHHGVWKVYPWVMFDS